jgi:hypothetical protein
MLVSFLPGTSPLLLSEKLGLLFTHLLHANKMKRNGVFGIAGIFSEANNAFYLALCRSHEDGIMLVSQG